MSDAVFIDEDGKVKLRVKVVGGTPPDISITKAVSGAAFIDSDGDVKVQVYADGSDVVVASGDAQASHVLAPKTFTNSSGAQTGTMVDRTSSSTAPNGSPTASVGSVTIWPAAGFYDGTSAKVVITDSNIDPSNVKVGIDFLGTNGTFTADATATAADIKTGKTAYVNGVKITGTAP